MTRRPDPKALGNWGEEVASHYLSAKGYVIVGRGLRINKAEIDILADRKGASIIVEVKTLATDRFGNPEDKLNDHKVRTLVDAAHELSYINPLIHTIRFDLITIIGVPGRYRLKHWEDAF